MKKLLLSFSALFLFAAGVIAQPTIPGSKFFIPGTTMVYVDAGFTTLNTGTPGANQTWDFSGLTNTGSGYTTQVVATSSTPYASSFPNSNAALTDPTQSTVNYTMLNTAGSALEFQGFVVDLGTGMTAQMVYSDPQQVFGLPLTYNATITDTYAGSATISAPPFVITRYHSGTTTSVVDGYGTLIDPTGTYTNVLRVKWRDVYTDSTVTTVPGSTPTVTHSIVNTYFFVDGNGANALDRVRIEIDSTDDNGALTVETAVWYLGSVSTGVSTVNPNAAFSVYPNPAANELNVKTSADINETVTYSILDLTGRTIRTFEVEMVQGAPATIPVNDLSSGAYLLKGESDNMNWTTRFIRQ